MQTDPKGQPLIARLWKGTTQASKSEAYLQYLHETGVKGCRATPGNRGVVVLRQIDGDHAHFLFASLWDSFEAIRRFAGPEPEKAVYHPSDEAFLETLEPTVSHYEVAFAAWADDEESS